MGRRGLLYWEGDTSSCATIISDLDVQTSLAIIIYKKLVINGHRIHITSPFKASTSVQWTDLITQVHVQRNMVSSSKY